MILAESFASSPAGYVTGLGMLILVPMGGYSFKRFASRLDRFESGLTTVTQALAVLVQRDTDDRPQIDQIPNLVTAQAVLLDRMDRHEKWAQDEHSRIRDNPHTRPPRPGGTP